MDIPNQIDLKVAEIYILNLPSLGTAGYVWSYAVQGENDRPMVAITAGRAEHLPSTESQELPVGSSLDEQFTIR